MDPGEWEEKHLVEERLSRILEEIEDWPLNREVMRYIISSGGKRTRPIIVLLACRLVGGDIREALDAAIAVEFTHIASLIHDDILDEGRIRHGIPTIYEKYGLDQAILIGDFLISNSIYLGSKYDEKVIKDLAIAAMNMAEGEILDTRSRIDPDFSEEDYYEVIKKKTASLFSSATSIGARIGGAPEEVILLLKELGMKAGIAYQILDDLLEFMEIDVDKYSKDTSLTLPILLNRRMRKDEVRVECLNIIKSLVDDCMEILSRFPPSEARERLGQVISYMTLGQIRDEACV
ncbi:MAG TPA: polyprenyl synthetase family protein [Candidatus Syntrophoarchaeum butanivorans]|uniref:Polyprenyl synthetase family protein n=1 Tax=Candidatus Syntropharchaeum butanivorans TaxID=1839936 RepID=A0A7C0X1B2_9EURY|nr:polyprenyl synthetase family protein [Candidatus Syntrophoarchaeum butanivorans]